jgi:hypothetical protein
LRRIKSSKVDVEGSRGTQIICEEVQAEDRFQALPEIRNLLLLKRLKITRRRSSSHR